MQSTVDQLYLIAENLAQDFSLFPRRETANVIKGLMSSQQIEKNLEKLRGMDVDAYIAATVSPGEEASRPGSRDIIASLDLKILNEVSFGSYYAAETEMLFDGVARRVGFISQNREYSAGVWGPEHHEMAAKMASDFAVRSIPIVCLIDTPGADANEVANANNQAHSISRLIAELCNVDVPTLGIVIGQGYSGGAIPLAAANLLLSLRTGVLNTIHPKGLASLVRKYNLSWQECAKSVGVSSFELYKQGNIDGIIDYDPGEEDKIHNLRNAIVSGILTIEQLTRDFVNEHPEILEHYKRNLNRYFNPSKTLSAVHTSSTLKLRTSPTEYPNVFGVAYRYLRYLGLRRRIKSTTTTQYGRLASSELPAGELQQRVNREQRSAFLSWLLDPDKVLYEDAINKAWKNYVDKKAVVGDARGRIAQLIFGEPTKNYETAKRELCLVSGLHLYNRWKAGSRDNLNALIDFIADPETNGYLLQMIDVKNVKSLLNRMADSNDDFVVHLKSRFTHEGRKLFGAELVEEKSDGFLCLSLVAELNLIVESTDLFNSGQLQDTTLSEFSTQLIAARSDVSVLSVPLNRRLLEDTLWGFVERKTDEIREVSDQGRTILDVILDEDVRDDFVQECQNLITFGYVYDNLITDLVSVAKQAHESRTLSMDFITQLLDRSVDTVLTQPSFEGLSKEDLKDRFAAWIGELASSGKSSNFLKSVEEWIRVVHRDKSDTLFVVISFFFEKLLPEYYGATLGTKRYEGKVEPVRIGRRKDFWNRLTIAYRDLLFHEVLTREKRSKNTTAETLIERYVENFEELNGTLMSANPVAFPTFRPSIESALKNNVRPHGLITGIGDFKTEGGCYRAGLVFSNVAFQAGSIDNSDCVRFCKLLVDCAEQRLPVVCFVSSGGMQTKEGAAALFTMAVVNDRVTRFVRDNDLPIIMFGYGDCTGGAQASFVTHPLAQTYYFSGTSMPFAGQTVVESNLPFTCLLSNYLSVKPDSMNGLVIHPFADQLDAQLLEVDPALPMPTEQVDEVVDRIMSGILTAAEPIIKTKEASEAELIRPVKRTLIHARGCTAVKLVSKAIEFGYEVVLVQSDPDMESVPADMVRTDSKHALVCIGGNTSDESYLNALSVLKIADIEGVDSLHPGIGFLSEDPNFARIVRQRGINFIGPSVASMETMGNKSNAINTTMSIDVPVVPGSHGIVNTAAQAAEIAEKVVYPILLKAVHGGGGKGIQVVERPEQLHSLFQRVTAEAKAAFGNGDVYIEKFVTSLRHIEAQILRDTHGNTRVLGIRDCSVQRNNQKLMEESGSTMLPQELRDLVCHYAEKIAGAVDYIGAGTVEFIYDVPSNAVYFMEMNTRLQVEHPVTEFVTGIDIVQKQFEIASGGSIADLAPSENGYALEVRVNAEKAIVNSEGAVSFNPTPGLITGCELPEAEDIRLISMAGEGKVISPFYDSLIIQIICYGKDRNDTIAKMLDYLDKVKITGICTNISLIKRILKDQEFIDGIYDTTYLPKFLKRTDIDELIREIDEASGNDGKAIDMEMLKIEGSDEIKVLSPSTGVFYRTPSPSEPEYVAVGDVISTEITMCQLEAMKMFTPMSLNSFSSEDGELYSSDQKYQVTRVNLTTGQQVNEGDLLFVVKPMAIKSELDAA
ncbi:MAG: acetyl/propionyl-CoA carboxylase alpha subunit/acetyl-CoA carboxylase beta subunit [Candidatus Azotimanducaceae bacterium]|jgi:acetyl/propionyl-CoA carboxylase alpha subunit/acetyl-CoA carboxylase beta subunit